MATTEGSQSVQEEHRPASTLMIVRSLALPELRFEVEAIDCPR